MPDSNSLVSNWMDRHLTGEEIVQLSTRLARDRGLADELAEMAGMVQALAYLAPHAPPARFVPRHSLTRILTGAAAALAAAGLAVLFWPGAPPRSAPREAAATSVSVVGSRPAPGALPRPPRSQEERARASLDRLLRRHSIAQRTYSETTLRDIAAECLDASSRSMRSKAQLT